MSTLFLTRFRYVTLWLARTLGSINCWLTSEWRPPLLLLGIIALSIWLAEWIAIHFHLFNVKTWTWLQAWNILAVYTLSALFLWAWQARKRVVVEEFIDYAANQTTSSGQSKSGDKPKSSVQGLSMLLIARLSQLHDLYHYVDEQREIPSSAGVSKDVDITIKVEDMANILKNAVSAQSKFTLGPVEIPVGTLMALFGRLVQGPRIIGSLHTDKDCLILIARLVGGKGKHPSSWRIEQPLSHVQSEGQQTYNLDDIVKELAYRMFTDLELPGAAHWRAVAYFTEGLQKYRDALRTPKERKLNLLKAEQMFLQALAEDEDFDLAYYNLGVVYLELGRMEAARNTLLGRMEAARNTFIRAINQNHDAWQAYYGLMVTHYQDEKYESAIELSESVIALRPDIANMARAYRCKGLAQRKLGEMNPPERREKLKEAIESRKKSVALSWKALCKAALEGESVAGTENGGISQLETLASDCLSDLAVAYGYQAKEYYDQAAVVHQYRCAEALLRQSLFLNKCDTSYYFELGKTCYEWGQYAQAIQQNKAAIQQYKAAIRIDPGRTIFRAYLALAYAAQNNKKDMLIECNYILSCPSRAFADEDTLDIIARAYQTLNLTDQSQRLKDMQKLDKKLQRLLNRLGVHPEKGNLAIDILKRKLAEYRQDYLESHTWEYATVAYYLGRLYYRFNDFSNAEKKFKESIDTFAETHSLEIGEYKLRVWYAQTFLDQQNYKTALQMAELALSYNPLRSYERELLGDVYSSFNEFELAIDAWEATLLLRPDDPGIHLAIGSAYVRIIEHCRELMRIKTTSEKAIAHLEKAHTLYESDQQEKKAAVCYYLGLIHSSLHEYEKAISNLLVSKQIGPAPLHSTLWLANAYLYNKEYNKSIQQFSEILSDANIQQFNDLLNKASQQDANKINEIIEPGFGEYSLVELLAWACWGKAYAYAQRDANLSGALQCIEDAQEEYIKWIEPTKSSQCQANYLDCKGWILLKQAKVNKLDKQDTKNGQGKIDEAIKCLNDAISLTADIEVYFHLALAFESKLQSSNNETDVQHLPILIEDCCQHVQELDLYGDYTSQINDLRQRVKDKSQPVHRSSYYLYSQIM